MLVPAMKITLAVAVLFLVLQVITSAGHKVGNVYVSPSNSTSAGCQSVDPGLPCYPLAHIKQNVDKYFTSDATLIFLPGTHNLEDSIAIPIHNVTNFSMIGTSNFTTGFEHLNESMSRIQCIGSGKSGFNFSQASNIHIENLTFIGCGQVFHMNNDDLNTRAAITFITVWNVTMSGVTIRNSTGYGLFAENSFGIFEIHECVFVNNSGVSGNLTQKNYHGGNARFWYRECPQNSTASLQITSSWFLHGNDTLADNYTSKGTGITAMIECPYINMSIINTTVSHNQALSGANIFILCVEFDSSNYISISNCTTESAVGHWGGGLRFWSLLPKSDDFLCNAQDNSSHVILHVKNTKFIGNKAGLGGAVYIDFHYESGRVECGTDVRQVVFENCNFSHNVIEPLDDNEADNINTKTQRMRVVDQDGAVMRIIRHKMPGYVIHSNEIRIVFTSCVFERNSLPLHGQHSYLQVGTIAAIFLIDWVIFKDCSFIRNNSTVVTPLNSNLIFEGDILFEENIGKTGGALKFLDTSSVVLLRNNTHVKFIKNHARETGGAIFAQQLINAPCIFQVDVPDGTSVSELQQMMQIEFINNTATHSGSAIYGGSLDYCQTYQHLKHNGKSSFYHFSAIYKEIFTQQLGNSAVSSDPYRVCLCNDAQPDCNLTNSSKYLSAYPGERFTLSVVAVGQKEGVVPALIEATPNNSTICQKYKWQEARNVCSILNYRILSKCGQEVLNLAISNPTSDAALYYHTSINVTVSLHPCPWGFKLLHYNACGCDPILKKSTFQCDIDNKNIRRRKPIWIGCHRRNDSWDESVKNSCEGIILHGHCPFDYCTPHDINITANTTDLQCASNRTGILCGACRKGLSLALGTTQCLECSNMYLLLLLPFALAGPLLVLLLMACNLTVSQGTINGLIFYANIVHLNHVTFSPPHHIPTLTTLFTVFISWLNLDLGIETCFYDGMDTYAKIWLHFTFPLYIWMLAGVIVVLSRRFAIIARGTGRHAVQILATLIQLSFAKLERAVIFALLFTSLSLSDGSNRVVWLPDGNLEYLRGKHIPLFIAALVALIISVLYTFPLLFIQCLQRFNARILSWVRRFKPLFDAYTGPYKDKSRFWTGHLLLIRLILYISFALNSNGDPRINLLLVIAACFHLLMLSVWVFRGVYKKWPLDVLESSFFINLGVLSATTCYILESGGSQLAATYISISIAFVTFIGILTYHSHKQVTSTRAWKQFSNWLSEVKETLLKLMESTAPAETADSDEEESFHELQTQLIPAPANYEQYREPLLAYEDDSV